MMELPPGTNAIVDAAVEEAAQTLFTAADVPLARKPTSCSPHCRGRRCAR
jgi:hypothetical protein